MKHGSILSKEFNWWTEDNAWGPIRRFFHLRDIFKILIFLEYFKKNSINSKTITLKVFLTNDWPLQSRHCFECSKSDIIICFLYPPKKIICFLFFLIFFTSKGCIQDFQSISLLIQTLFIEYKLNRFASVLN